VNPEVSPDGIMVPWAKALAARLMSSHRDLCVVAILARLVNKKKQNFDCGVKLSSGDLSD
jgi:hypothetical protein